MSPEDAQKLKIMIRRHVGAQIDLSWAGTGSPEETELLLKEAREAGIDMFTFIRRLTKVTDFPLDD